MIPRGFLQTIYKRKKPKNAMKAIVCEKYGPPEVLELKDVPKPKPKDNELLVKIYTTSVTAADYRIRGFNVPKGFGVLMRLFLGFNRPKFKILGLNLAGKVEAVGENVTKFKVGDEIFGTTGVKFGTYAEYVCVSEDATIDIKPKSLSNNEAAGIPFGALTALYFLKEIKVEPGQNVLINGASGAVGVSAVQLAKYFGTEVTAVCSSSNIDLVRSLGADHTIDYTQKDFTQGKIKYDVIIETTGKIPFKKCQKALVKNGKCVLLVAGVPDYFKIFFNNLMSNKKIITGTAQDRKEDLLLIKKLLEEKKLKTVIDKTYPLENIVEAHKYADKGHKKGNVVITVNS